MNRVRWWCCVAGLLGLALVWTTGCASLCGRPCAKRGQRMGWVTGLKPEKVARYKELHAQAWPGVLKTIKDNHLRNYSIYLTEIDGRPVLFSYLEYTGADFSADMKRMAADPETQRWWQETDPCQAPLPAAAAKGQIWDETEEVFHYAGAVDVPARKVVRYGMITGLKAEKEAWYRTLHQTPWPAVKQQIKNGNIRNYSIYLKKIGDRLYLLSYFEYVGGNFDADMAKMAQDDTTRRWWQQTDPCQNPLPAAAAKGKIWDGMAEVFHTD